MKILHLDSGRSLRGGQRQLMMLFDGLAARGYEQTLLARPPLLGVRPARRWGKLNLMREARKADLIHAHDAGSHTWAAVCCPATPLVVSRRVAFPLGRGRLSRWKYSRPKAFLAVSKFVAEELRRGGVDREKISVVHDGTGISENDGKRGPRWDGDAGERLRAVAPASDDPLKGSGLFLEACGRAGVEGVLSRDLTADLSGADLFIHLSQSEGLGSAILAAMARGVPVIASRVGGIPELVEDEVTGLLVENRVADVARAIKRFQCERALAEACAGRALRLVRAEFSDDTMVDRTERVYRAVLSAAPLP